MTGRDEKLPRVGQKLSDDFAALANLPQVLAPLVEGFLGLGVDLLGILVNWIESRRGARV